MIIISKGDCMDQNVVTKVVTDEIDITTRFIQGMTEFALTKGVDLIEAILIFLMGYVVCRYIRRVAEHILTKSDVDPSAKTFIEEIIFFFCLAIVAIVALGTAGVGNGTLAAAFGGIGLAIGLGLKDNIGNVASGIFILIFRPFQVGDYIQIGTSQGTVVSISIMYTILSTLGNQRIVVPNSSLTKTVIKNFSTNDIRNLEYTFDVGYDTDLKACVDLLRKVFTESDYVIEKEKLAVYVSEMAESSIRIYVRASVDRTKYYDALNAMYIQVKESFDAAGIDIPYPQVVVHKAEK